MRYRPTQIAAGTLVALVVALVVLYLVPAPQATPAPAAQTVDTAQADPANPVAPPDGPAPDTALGVDAQSLLDELRTHAVTLGPDDTRRVLTVGDAAVARGVPDVSPEDAAIRADVDRLFADLPADQRREVTRCLAEYAERVIARNAGTTPPDSDDHNSGGGN
jgi:hypothetical protein